jgi:hypothetical protein
MHANVNKIVLDIYLVCDIFVQCKNYTDFYQDLKNQQK